MTTNYTSQVHLVRYLLPFLQGQSTPTSLIFTTSGLALVPLLRAPNYSASKAAMHHFILCLRRQLSDLPSNNVKIVEILPPAVQTELHDAKHQPDIKDGHKIGMTMEDFMKEAWEGLCEGKSDVPVGMSKMHYGKDGEGWEVQRQKAFGQMVEGMKKMMENK
jgi:short-subunit dehydrogenase involved in D-alanine esterification of teichoic acids